MQRMLTKCVQDLPWIFSTNVGFMVFLKEKMSENSLLISVLKQMRLKKRVINELLLLFVN